MDETLRWGSRPRATDDDRFPGSERDCDTFRASRAYTWRCARSFYFAAQALPRPKRDDVIRAWRIFGLHMGTAYQAKDDLLDEVVSEQLLGKPIGNDPKNGSRTYLELAYPHSVIATVPSVSAREDVDSAVLEFTERVVGAMQAVPERPAREQLEKLAASLAQRRP
jgi:geranylgeranyl pyrophosphate synthase